MSSFQRIQNIVIGLITIVIAISMMALPERGYGLAALLISISFAFSGLRTLIYYFTMARFMVGGKRILFRGLILLDLGLFTFTLVDNSKLYVILYLVIIHAISGAISIVKSLQVTELACRGLMLLVTYHRHKSGNAYGDVNSGVVVLGCDLS